LSSEFTLFVCRITELVWFIPVELYKNEPPLKFDTSLEFSPYFEFVFINPCPTPLLLINSFYVITLYGL
jgi:hypothetical protein